MIRASVFARRAALLVCVFMVMPTLVMAQDTGVLQFKANGEDFVRQGFVSKDGWHIQFDHLFVTLAKVRAYQTNPPYQPEAGELTTSNAMVGLAGAYTVDLAAGDENAEPILVGESADIPAGYYNAVSWEMVNDDDGYTLVLVGTADKDGETVAFTIRNEFPYDYSCGAYVGDERKSIVQAGGTADIELTFHLDHVFGDAELPADDDLNMGASGFAPFAVLAEDGQVDVDMADLEAALSAEDYQLLVDTLFTLGHVGEGHCHAAN